MNENEIAAWEEAYRRFETPAEEIEKFRRRLLKFGVNRWGRDSKVLELFCGRGSGLKAWAGMGFSDVTGLDLSFELLNDVAPEFNTIVADARNPPLEDESFDVVSIHGGLHHLPVLPDDLKKVIQQCRRVLKSNGHLLIVEPWLTPFLRFVHYCSQRQVFRRLWPKLDALAVMIELEQQTYYAWLDMSDVVKKTILDVFPNANLQTSWGKLLCRATKQ